MNGLLLKPVIFASLFLFPALSNAGSGGCGGECPPPEKRVDVGICEMTVEEDNTKVVEELAPTITNNTAAAMRFKLDQISEGIAKKFVLTAVVNETGDGLETYGLRVNKESPDGANSVPLLEAYDIVSIDMSSTASAIQFNETRLSFWSGSSVQSIIDTSFLPVRLDLSAIEGSSDLNFELNTEYHIKGDSLSKTTPIFLAKGVFRCTKF